MLQDRPTELIVSVPWSSIEWLLGEAELTLEDCNAGELRAYAVLIEAKQQAIDMMRQRSNLGRQMATYKAPPPRDSPNQCATSSSEKGSPDA